MPPSLAPQPFANRTVGAEERAEPARSQQALVPPGPDAEALFRSWAIAAQAKEMAQDVVKRIAAIDSPAWPAEATAEPKAAVPKTLATA
ncbi:hypothetical protein [Paracoccus thiocyanatus]|uniref:Uncharacterized protein n=1 Tax=Paracoccus thiocyanatus TaxID=34006 RepID=A0A3D8PDQ9_9RHOB|nr:hypothetical protein [Paracoccus thiocyanatus]RDW14203.1 hypothetical protein DIE28_03980 [Paracoccus thiocyanatus]